LIVIDDSGKIASAAVIADGGRTQSLYALPFGVFLTVPQLEGAIELECNGGSEMQFGYVTRHIHVWLRFRTADKCSENGKPTDQEKI
jgi:hypothetical protein